MADQKISELTALTGANVADDDAIAIVDTSATETKKIVFSELKNALDTATGFVRITGDTMTGALDVQSTITSDGLTVDTNTLHVDATNNRVGIGTSSPSNNLEIFTNSGDEGITIKSTGNTSSAVIFDSVRNANSAISAVRGQWDGTPVADMLFYAGADYTNKDDGYIVFRTSSADNIAERMRITSSGSVGIGTSSIDNKVNIQESALSGRSASNGNTSMTIEHATDTGIQFFSATQTQLRFGDAASTGAGAIIYEHSDNKMRFSTSALVSFDVGGSEAMRIDSSGNVGIGVIPETATSTYKALELGYSTAILARTSANQSYFANNVYHDSSWKYKTTDPVALYQQLDDQHVFFNAASGTADTTVSFSEAMRIDSSGNLLVGKTSIGTSTDGFEARAGGTTGVSDTSGPALYVNRNGSDGEMVLFQKVGSTVGSIGTQDGRLTIGDGATGLRIAGDLNTIVPWNTTTNLLRDSAIDLGQAAQRFKDLYLSGGVYLGGTVAANKLDDYEEGTWTPTVLFYSGTLTVNAASYTKIGRQVTAMCDLSFSGTDADRVDIVSLPFTPDDSSGSEDLGGAFVTRTDVGQEVNFLVNTGAARVQAFDNSASAVSYTTYNGKNVRLVIIYQAA